MKKILITGKSGVTGSAFQRLEKIYENKYEFVYTSSKFCDLTNLQDSLDVISDINPNFIINLAAKSGGIGLSANFQGTLLRDNLAMNMNILEISRILKIEKLLLVLSSAIYPVKASMPFNEISLHDGEPHQSAYGYSFAKRILEPAIRAYREEFNLNVIGAIPNGIFGEDDNFSDDAPMLPSLIRRFYENIKTDEKIVVWGDGSPLREYTYSEDVAKSFIWLLENYDNSLPLNTGSTEEISIKQIAYMICDTLRLDRSRIFFDESKPKGIHRKPTDNSNFIKISNFKYLPFEDGLSRTLSWFKEKYENDRESIKLFKKS